MPEPSSSVLRHQNDAPMMDLLRAVAAVHGRVQRLGNLQLALSVGIALAGLVASFAAVIAKPVVAVGALWGLANAAGLASWADQALRRAALLQEMFDVRLFALPWNTVLVGVPEAAHEVSRLSKRYHGNEEFLRNYYEIPDLPRPYDVLASQQENLGWGSRIRLRYAYAALTAVGCWSLSGLVVGVAANLTVGDLVLRWFVPSTGLLLFGLDTMRRQLGVAKERGRILVQVREDIASAVERPISGAVDEGLLVLARQVQDSLFLTRLRVSRVPNWFFQWFHPSDRIDFRAAMHELADTLRTRRGPAQARTPDPDLSRDRQTGDGPM